MEYILCHGSGNRFAMIDAAGEAAALEGCDLAALARSVCRFGNGLDGLLLLVHSGGAYGMRMFNPDGSEAEMCGNGIRCVARLAAERYVGTERFTLRSGGREYEVACAEPIFGQIPTFGVTIPLRRASDDFRWPGAEQEWLAGTIGPLAPDLRFTYLNPGNPHLAACVDTIDMERLEHLGERVLALPEIFPRGVNVSLYRQTGARSLFVSTYERGAGITFSCGTAMTASSTAACLLGLCDFGSEIEVVNRGGMVRCRPLQQEGRLRTILTGNATFEADGRMTFDGVKAVSVGERRRTEETAAYDAFLMSVAAKTDKERR